MPPSHTTQNSLIIAHSPIFYVQMASFGLAFALQWSLFITADKLLGSLPHLDTVTGYLLTLSALSGCLASIVAGVYVDWSKRFKEFIKGCYVGIAVTALGLNWFFRREAQEEARSNPSELDSWIIVTLLVTLGAFAIPVFPISLELGNIRVPFI